MKRLEDIERLEADELERISSDRSVQVPESLHRKIEDTLTAAQLVKAGRARAARWKFAFAPAAIAVVAAIMVGVNHQHARQIPADTFDNPQEAYAELRRTFGYISGKLTVGKEATDAALTQLDNASKMIENITRK